MKAAIVGAGKMGQMKAKACAALGIEVAYIDSLNKEAVARLVKKYGAVAADWKDFIEVPDVDIVFVCTSHNMLKEVSIAALQQGKHVVIEKPAGRNSEEIQEIIDAHQKALKNKFVAVKVSLNHRYHPMIAKAQHIARSGKLGELLYMTGEYGHGGREGMQEEWRCKKSMSGGGELLDQGSHILDLYAWIMGKPETITGYAPTLYYKNSEEPVEDNCFFRLRNGKKCGQFHVSWTLWKNDFRLKIVGKDGMVIVNGLGRHYGVESLKVYKRGAMGKAEQEEEYTGEDESFIDELKYFLTCIENQKQPEGNLNDALHSMQLVESVYEENK